MDLQVPQKVLSYIQEAYHKYYDSAFWMRDEVLMRERRKLLESPGLTAQDILIETVLPYPSTIPIQEACAAVGLGSDVALALRNVVFGENEKFKLRAHQADSLVTSLAPSTAEKRNVVVTSGTGSGKTESFLLPIFARLIAERLHINIPRISYWWEQDWDNARSWQGLRGYGNDGVTPAVRAMLLYPTNALVEDQVSRIRQAAFRAKAIHGKPLFFFGRYTGATPGGMYYPVGNLKSADKTLIKDLARDIRQIDKEAYRLRSIDMETRSQFQDPRCGEMLTRWDMIEAPPDILITNVSMLNVMLLRENENRIFDKTREWLQSSEDNVFSLIVDELHGYRGSQGTEVALVVRNLLDRLGLDSDSRQLRCLGTSASLDGREGLEYLEQFFGVDRKTFAVFPGSPVMPKAEYPLREEEVLQFSAGVLAGDQVATNQFIERFSPRQTVGAACLDAGRRTNGQFVPVRLQLLGEALFGGKHSDKALETILTAANQEGSTSFEFPLPSFRAHMFLRQIQGMWACSNPKCNQVDEDFQYDARTIGKLYKNPALKCGCGGQVLELLYCYDCGEMYLGGYVTKIPQGMDTGEGYFLESGPAEDYGKPPALVFERPYGEFMWYWPGGRSTGELPGPWTHKNPESNNTTSFSFSLQPRTTHRWVFLNKPFWMTR